MQPLIDADILLHEIGWSGEFKDKDTGDDVLLPFETVEGILNKKIALICDDVGASKPPILFVTASEELCKSYNRTAKYQGREEVKYVKNFRYEVAKTRPYKGTRNNTKPFHFNNILHYLLSEYDTRISTNGLEADDMLCIYQMNNENTIICSRDKDLRMCPGWHFSWECGKQRSIGPIEAGEVGSLEPYGDGVLGYGVKFFYYQMLVGDSVDGIPGLPKWGKVKALKLLAPMLTEEEMFTSVKSLYKEVMGDNAKDYFLEQANLLWMIQEENGRYSLPKFVTKPT